MAVRVTTVDVPVVDVKATRQRLGRRGSGRGGRLNFGPFASGGGNFGFDLGHSQLIKALGLSVGLNVFQPVGRGSQSSDKVGDTEDNHGGLSIALDHKAVVVLGGAVHNLAELGSGGDGGNFFVIPSAWVIDQSIHRFARMICLDLPGVKLHLCVLEQPPL